MNRFFQALLLGSVFILILGACGPKLLRKASGPGAEPEATERANEAGENSFKIGVDANYYLQLKRKGKVWTHDGKNINPLRQFSAQGVKKKRIRLWVGDTGPGGLSYAIETARRAQQNGLEPYLVIFLSDQWADYVKQPVPERWSNLKLAEQVQAVEDYTERIARHFQAEGIGIDFYEIGNEIDFGISGEFEERWSHRFNLNWMKTRIWPGAAKIIRAAQNGVCTVEPDAKFMLHLAQWWNPEFNTEFYQTMLEHEVQIDYLGLTYYPTAELETGGNQFQDLSIAIEKLTEKIKRPVVIAEFAYPSTDQIKGQFAGWNKKVPGYKLTPQGQKRWLSDFLEFAENNSEIVEAYYWSPEWNPTQTWAAFSLFDNRGHSKPALTSLR
ncbi:MAG: glycosyl hydrolase 53 family protein [bacterium]